MKNLNSHTRQLVAVFVTLNVLFFYNKLQIETFVLLTWCVYTSVNLILDWFIILNNTAADVKKFVANEDSSNILIFVFIVFGALISILAVFFLLISVKKNTPHFAIQTVLSVIAVVLSWFLIHTVFTLRYAHLFYLTQKNKLTRGLSFPDGDDPDYTDFAYFSFTIGMTFQVSDIEITSQKIRKLVLIHAILSFAFNTAIITLSINIISSLISK